MFHDTGTIAFAIAFAAGVGIAVATNTLLTQGYKSDGEENWKEKHDALQKKLDKEIKLRAQERNGRTNAEREARTIAQKQQEKDGYNFEAIGVVESCFADRRGR